MNETFRLTERERAVLLAATLRADATMKEIGKHAGVREHAARYVIASFLRRGIVRPVYLIDNYRLGYTDFGVFLTRGAESSKGRKEFEARIERIPQVFWLAKTVGDFQYGLTFFAKRAIELDDLFGIIRPPGQGAYFEKLVGLRIEWSVFSPKYLSPGTNDTTEITMSCRDEPVEIDQTDHKVLTLLAKNPSGYPAQLARAANMSAPQLSYRLDKLRELKVLRCQMYLIDLSKLGYLTYRILIVERSLTPSQKVQFRKFCHKHPNVAVFLFCTGAWDYEIRFETAEPEELDMFCRELYDLFGSGIGSLRVVQQSRVLKRYPYPAV